jgi:acid phosphatase
VVVVVEENRELATTLSQGPYFAQLGRQYAFAGQFYSIRHNSEPDYLAMTSGMDPNAFRVYDVRHIGDLVNAAGLTWGSYFQNMPVPCDREVDWAVGYQRTHNPFVQYADVFNNPVYCDLHVQSRLAWDVLLKAGTIPNYAMVVPDLFNDSHSGSMPTSEHWLQGFLTPLMHSALWSSTAVIITYDEGTTNAGFNGSDGGHIYTVAVGPDTNLGYTSTHQYNSYSVLTTSEWLLGVGSLGQNDSWMKNPPMYDLFLTDLTHHGRGHFLVSGTVATPGGVPLAGASVTANGSKLNETQPTSALGGFRFSLPNGTYGVSVNLSGFWNAQRSLVVNGSAVQNVNISLNPRSLLEFGVSGSVTDSAGSPVPGAEVTASGGPISARAQTNANGSYHMLLENGTYLLGVTYAGFFAFSKTVVVNGIPLSNVNFTFAQDLVDEPTFVVSGSITEGSTNDPVAGAVVYANSSIESVVVRTSANGSFQLNLPNGTYSITVVTNQSNPVTRSLTVAGTPTIPLLIAVSPALEVSAQIGQLIEYWVSFGRVFALIILSLILVWAVDTFPPGLRMKLRSAGLTSLGIPLAIRWHQAVGWLAVRTERSRSTKEALRLIEEFLVAPPRAPISLRRNPAWSFILRLSDGIRRRLRKIYPILRRGLRHQGK